LTARGGTVIGRKNITSAEIWAINNHVTREEKKAKAMQRFQERGEGAGF